MGTFREEVVRVVESVGFSSWWTLEDEEGEDPTLGEEGVIVKIEALGGMMVRIDSGVVY